MATRKRHSPEQIVRKLMAADRLLAEGKDTAAACRELGLRVPKLGGNVRRDPPITPVGD